MWLFFIYFYCRLFISCWGLFPVIRRLQIFLFCLWCNSKYYWIQCMHTYINLFICICGRFYMIEIFVFVCVSEWVSTRASVCVQKCAHVHTTASEIAFLIFIFHPPLPHSLSLSLSVLSFPFQSSFRSFSNHWLGKKISIKFNCWTCYKSDIMLIESGYNLWWCESFYVRQFDFGLYFIASCNSTDCKLILIPQNIKQLWRFR